MTNGTGKGIVYEGSASEMKDSDWLAVEDMQAMGGEITVTISKVFEHHNVKFQGGRTEKRKFSLSFLGANKQLVLNATNIKRLQKMFGNRTKEWVGKKIKLYLEDDRLPADSGKGVKHGPCTRICPEILEQNDVKPMERDTK